MTSNRVQPSQQQFSISDFIQWDRQKELVLNPEFQRRIVWNYDAKCYLIDTILQGFSMPKVFLRTNLDVKRQTSVRDVVDGQQRLRTILDFSKDGFRLNKRSADYRGHVYSELPEEIQQAFLGYQIGVEHLFQSDNTYVLEMFSRLNSYNLPLNAAERRHAAFDSELRWLVKDVSTANRNFLEKYDIISIRTMVRMEDDAFFAELVNILTYGVVDGGAAELDKLYKAYPEDFPEGQQHQEIIKEAVQWMDREIGIVLTGTPLRRPFQVMMIFAAYVHITHGLPLGRLRELPPRIGLGSSDRMRQRLDILASVLDDQPVVGDYANFRAATSATTRLKSRSIRFRYFYWALSASADWRPSVDHD